MSIVESMKNRQVNDSIPDFNVGDTIRFRVKVVEGNKERFQPFQGTVILSTLWSLPAPRAAITSIPPTGG